MGTRFEEPSAALIATEPQSNAWRCECCTPLRHSTRWALIEHEDTSMSTKKPLADRKFTTVVADDPEDLKGTLKGIGGSQSDHWNNILANQTVQTLWLAHSDESAYDA